MKKITFIILLTSMTLYAYPTKSRYSKEIELIEIYEAETSEPKNQRQLGKLVVGYEWKIRYELWMGKKDTTEQLLQSKSPRLLKIANKYINIRTLVEAGQIPIARDVTQLEEYIIDSIVNPKKNVGVEDIILANIDLLGDMKNSMIWRKMDAFNARNKAEKIAGLTPYY